METHKEAGRESRPKYIYVDEKLFTWGRWFHRKLYTIVHALFASFWFYFVPFSSILLSYTIPFAYEGDFSEFKSD